MANKKEKKKTEQTGIAQKADPKICILMTSPNKPRKYIVVADISEANLVMANAREKDKFVEFTLFERVIPIIDNSKLLEKGLEPAA